MMSFWRLSLHSRLKIVFIILVTLISIYLFAELSANKWTTQLTPENVDYFSNEICITGVTTDKSLNFKVVHLLEKILNTSDSSQQNVGFKLLVQKVLKCLGQDMKDKEEYLVGRSGRIDETTLGYFDIISNNDTKHHDSNNNTLENIGNGINQYINTTEYIRNKNIDPKVALFLQSPIINQHNYKFIINHPNACSGNDVTYILGVKSAVRNFQNRKHVRQHYSRKFVMDKLNKIKMFFFLGSIRGNSDIQKSILEENTINKDIIQGDFEDIYNNLPIKTAMAMKWTGIFCNHSMSKFMILIDDDLIFNPANVIKELTRYHQMSVHQYEKSLSSPSSLALSSKGTDPLSKIDAKTSQVINPYYIIGNLVSGWLPIRNPKSKYYLTKEDFPDHVLPPFILGGCKGFSSFTASLLFQAYQRVKLIHLEDVFFTGICAPKVGVSLYYNAEFLYKHQTW